MTRLLFAVLAALALATATPAQEAETGVQDTITSQLEAFTERDVVTAFTFASPMIQGMFGTPENFGMMVERGYPMVWNNDDVRFGEQREMRGMLLQRVYLRDTNGTLHALEYAMIPGPQGWLINGVTLVPLPDVGA